VKFFAGSQRGPSVTLRPDDVNNDNGVDIVDLGLLADAYNSSASIPKWNQNADLNADGKVNIPCRLTAMCAEDGRLRPKEAMFMSCRTRSISFILSAFLVLCCVAARPAFAQTTPVPPLMNFQGHLAKLDGTYSITFSLYDAQTGGNLK
jgi:hypothetical protein